MGSPKTCSILAYPTTARGSSARIQPMKRIGHARRSNNAMNPIKRPSVSPPAATRHEPTSSRIVATRAGSASSAASNVARRKPASTRSSRRARALIASRSVSALSRPRVFTTSAPSIDSCATAETSPIRSCARAAGPCIRLAKLRFITARAGNTTAAINARKISVAMSWTIARTISTITPVANGTGQNTSTAAFTSASMCASSSPVGVSRWYASASRRYRSAILVRSVAITRSPATPLKNRRSMIPRARRHPNVMSAATASQIFRGSTPPSNAGWSTSSVARPSAVVSPIEANANSTAPATETMNGAGCMRM